MEISKCFIEKGEELAKEHWNFVEQTLLQHGVKDNKTLSLAEFYYKSAFVHGFKHGIEHAIFKENFKQNKGALNGLFAK